MFSEDWFVEWIHDDITWCANECSNVECERNIINRLSKGGYYAAAYFKDTDTCPLKKEGKKDATSDQSV